MVQPTEMEITVLTSYRGTPKQTACAQHLIQFSVKQFFMFLLRVLFLLGTQSCFHGPRLATDLSNSSPKLYLLLPIQWLSLSYRASLSNSLYHENEFYSRKQSQAPCQQVSFSPDSLVFQTCPDMLEPQQQTQLRLRFLPHHKWDTSEIFSKMCSYNTFYNLISGSSFCLLILPYWAGSIVA